MSAPSAPNLKYVAIMSPSLCFIHNWSDEPRITRRLSDGHEASVVATRCFGTQKDALCWLTSPVYKEAVATSASLARKLPSSTAAASTSWLALVSATSRSCFETDEAGLLATLSAVQQEACICGKFSSATRAWEWLDGGSASSLLEVVGGPNVVPSSMAPSAEAELCPVASRGAGSGSGVSVEASARSPITSSLLAPLPGLRPHSTVSRAPSRLRAASVSSARLGKRALAPSAVPSGSLMPSATGVVLAASEGCSTSETASDGDSFSQGGASMFRALPKRHKGTLCAATEQLHDSPATSSDGSASLISLPDLVDCGWSNDSRASTQDAGSIAIHQLLRSSDRRRSQGDGRGHRRARAPRAAAGRAETRGNGGYDDGGGGGGDAETAASSISDLAGAGEWEMVCEHLFGGIQSAFISGGPGAGKSTLLRHLFDFLRKRYSAEGEVVVLAPTGTSAKTAGGITYHSFFGFIRDYDPFGVDAAAEARRLLATSRFGPIKARLRRARAVLLDEVSLVGADKLEVMHELLLQSRSETARPCLWFTFGDFLQLGPIKGAPMAFAAPCWDKLFGGAFLNLPGARSVSATRSSSAPSVTPGWASAWPLSCS